MCAKKKQVSAVMSGEGKRGGGRLALQSFSQRAPGTAQAATWHAPLSAVSGGHAAVTARVRSRRPEARRAMSSPPPSPSPPRLSSEGKHKRSALCHACGEGRAQDAADPSKAARSDELGWERRQRKGAPAPHVSEHGPHAPHAAASHTTGSARRRTENEAGRGSALAKTTPKTKGAGRCKTNPFLQPIGQREATCHGKGPETHVRKSSAPPPCKAATQPMLIPRPAA